MNVLVIGSGGREHALCWKLAQSSQLGTLYASPGNPGTANVAENVVLDISSHEELKAFILLKEISSIIVGPEAPLVDGIHDAIGDDPALSHVNVIGPRKEGATLEGSKDFAKQFMMRHNIPTARYQSFTKDTLDEGIAFLETLDAPYVLKADGLAAGKGVLIIYDLQEAKMELVNMLEDAKFGEASSTVVIEEFLSGLEFSVFALTDGKEYVILPEAKDYKRIGENDTGLNTGGMGAVSPVPFVDDVMRKKVEDRIIKPTIDGLAKDGIPYKGFVFFGLIEVNREPFVIEYNVRMGDPETEVVMPRLKTDLLELIAACGEGQLGDAEVEFDHRSVATVMAVSGGYPGNYEKGKPISGIENIKASVVFHAGTAMKEGKLVTNGGRVIALTAYGNNKNEALSKAYASMSKLEFSKMYYRKDIGFDL